MALSCLADWIVGHFTSLGNLHVHVTTVTVQACLGSTWYHGYIMTVVCVQVSRVVEKQEAENNFSSIYQSFYYFPCKTLMDYHMCEDCMVCS